MTDSQSLSAEQETPTGLRRYLIVLAGFGGSAVYEFTWSIAGVALPHMQGAFSATPDQIAWVMTAFIMGTVVTIACTGWLATRFGRKRVYLVSIAGFGFSLLMCATATSLEQEVFWRLMKGIFGAALLPLGQAITVDAFPPHRHGAATAIWSMGVIGGGILGPVAGGFVVEYLDWPWIFYLNVPLAVGAFFLAWVVLPSNPPDRSHRLDWFGFVTIITAATAFQLMMSRGERLDWFSSSEVLLEGAIALLALYLFIAHSLTTKHPFFRPALFRDRNYNLGLVAALANGAIATLPLAVLPLMLEQLAGYPVIDAGLLLFPRGIGLVIVSIILARYDQFFDPRLVMVGGFLVSLISGLYMVGWTDDVERWAVIWVNLAQGAGAGAVFIAINALTFSTLAPRLKTEGLALYYTVLFTGATVGIAGIVAVLTRMSQVAYGVVGAHINPYNPQVRSLTDNGAIDLDSPEDLIALNQEVLRQADLIGFSDAFLVAALISLSALPLALFFRKPQAGPR